MPEGLWRTFERDMGYVNWLRGIPPGGGKADAAAARQNLQDAFDGEEVPDAYWKKGK